MPKYSISFLKNILISVDKLSFLGSYYLEKNRDNDPDYVFLNDVLEGKKSLAEAEAYVNRKEQNQTDRNNQNAVDWAKVIADLDVFNQAYLNRSGSMHLPTYSRKLTETFPKIFSGTKRAGSNQSEIELVTRYEYKGIRFFFPIVDQNPVFSIIAAIRYLRNCTNGKTTQNEILHRCYDRIKMKMEIERLMKQGIELDSLFQDELTAKQVSKSPCKETLEQFIKRRASELATEAKNSTAKALKSSGGSFTTTWYRQELRRAYDFNYSWYLSNTKPLIEEYNNLCGNISGIAGFFNRLFSN